MRRTVVALIAAALLFASACMLFTIELSGPAQPGAGTTAPERAQAETKSPPAADAPTAAPPAATYTPPADPTAIAKAVAAAPDVASYTIDVTLDPEARRLEAAQVVTYRNTTREPFDELVFHLYLNAFKSPDTIFMRESGGQLRGFDFNPENSGWIEVEGLRVAGGGAELELELLEDGTLARAALPQPVAPGESISIELEFTAQLPQIFARTGWALDRRGDPFFLVAQWFPKLGVWTGGRWEAEPFHGNAEFFADFGDYQVTITLPDGYVTGASGLPVETRRSGGMQTVAYRADGVIDFAWVASPHLETTRQMAGPVEVVYLYLPEHDWSVRRVLSAVAGAVEQFSAWFGDYPYPRLTVVDVPEEGAGAGGMEYPTFITVGADNARDRSPGPTGWTNILEVIAVHEVAHQWWQSLVATNEAREPWLDEGFADYSTVRLLTEQYGLPFKKPDRGSFIPSFLEGRRQAYLRNPGVPMHGEAWEFAYRDYVIAAYAKPVMAFLTLERTLGEETVLEIFRAYFERYRFAHPTTEDFRAVAVEVSGEPLDWFFDGLVYGEATLNYAVLSIEGGEFTVERQGEIALPAEVLVTFADGAAETVRCPAAEKLCSRAFPGREIRAVEVDPERRLIIDLDWEDNGLAIK